MSGKLGFRILPSPPRVSASTIDGFRGVGSATIADAMGRFGFMDPAIESRTGVVVCGLATTVRCRPGDNLMLHKALELAAAGDIVVVDTCGNRTSAVFGELMGKTAVARQLGGLVVDGAVRDVQPLTSMRFPVYSRTVCPGGCDKDGPGEINIPICCGGVVVNSGDVVVGDRDGLAVVPAAHADEVLELVAKVVQRERARVAEIEGGVLFRPDVDELLRKRGVIG
jgi:4-hydroxy-4-methyl-2-oxoglutarate aldolase